MKEHEIKDLERKRAIDSTLRKLADAIYAKDENVGYEFKFFPESELVKQIDFQYGDKKSAIQVYTNYSHWVKVRNVYQERWSSAEYNIDNLLDGDKTVYTKLLANVKRSLDKVATTYKVHRKLDEQRNQEREETYQDLLKRGFSEDNLEQTFYSVEVNYKSAKELNVYRGSTKAQLDIPLDKLKQVLDLIG